MSEIQPFWYPEEAPVFVSRTTTQYARTPIITALNDRGLENARLAQLAKELPKGTIISGGFLNAVMADKSESASDIDLFFTGPQAFMEAYEILSEPSKNNETTYLQGYKPDIDKEMLLKDSKLLRFVKFKHEKYLPIQLVKLVWYESAEHCIDSFDLTCVQFAVDKNELVYNPLGMIDLARKRIVLHRMQFPTSTLRRLIKYAKKGFYACPGSLQRIATQVEESIRTNPGAEQFAYID